MDYATRVKVAKEALELLCERWPKALFLYEARRRPLKVGIDKDLKAALGGAINSNVLHLALGFYVNNPVYRSRLKEGATRIDLDGNPAGVVTAAEAVPALVPKLKVKKTPKPKVKKPPPKRDSLEALKEAARRRKAQAEGRAAS